MKLPKTQDYYKATNLLLSQAARGKNLLVSIVVEHAHYRIVSDFRTGLSACQCATKWHLADKKPRQEIRRQDAERWSLFSVLLLGLFSDFICFDVVWVYNYVSNAAQINKCCQQLKRLSMTQSYEPAILEMENRIAEQQISERWNF